MSVTPCKFELVSITALYIASKYEETTPLDAAGLLQHTNVDAAFSLEHILGMEQKSLHELDIDLSVPTAYTFLWSFYMAQNSNDQPKCMAKYIAELTLIDGQQYLSHLPSQISAASLIVANVMTHEPIETEELEHLIGYPVETLRSLIFLLAKSHAASATNSYDSLYNKYSHRNYMSVVQYSFDARK